MANNFTGTCPCGFNFMTPHGKDDAIAVMKHHVSRIHKDEFPNGQTDEEAMEHIKETT
jgi:hypothetical protein